MGLFTYSVYNLVCGAILRVTKDVDMKILILTLISVVLSSCAVKRTRDSDKTLRVMLDPKSTQSEDYDSIENALVESGKFYVIDRGAAFNAVKKEQSSEYTQEADRYQPEGKYAHYGQLLGAGAVVVVSSECGGAQSSQNIIYLAGHLATLGLFDKIMCKQFIKLVDTQTGEVVASAMNETGKHNHEVLDWSDAVEKLVDNYPKYFESVKKHEKLIKYEAESKELSEQMRNVSGQ